MWISKQGKVLSGGEPTGICRKDNNGCFRMLSLAAGFNPLISTLYLCSIYYYTLGDIY